MGVGVGVEGVLRGGFFSSCCCQSSSVLFLNTLMAMFSLKDKQDTVDVQTDRYVSQPPEQGCYLARIRKSAKQNSP